VTFEPPRAVATIRADGNAEIVIDGVAQRVLATTLEQTRSDVVAHVASRARTQGRPIQVDVYDPEGRFLLTVNPDGSLGEMTSNDLPEDTIPPAQVQKPIDPAPELDDTVTAWGPRGPKPVASERQQEQPPQATAAPPAAPQSVPQTSVPRQEPADPAAVASWMRSAASDPQALQPQHQQRPGPAQQAPVEQGSTPPAATQPTAQQTPVPATAQPSGPPPWSPGSPSSYQDPTHQHQAYPNQAQQHQAQVQTPPPGWPQDQGGAAAQPGSAVGPFAPETPVTRRQLRESFLKTEQPEAPATKGFRGVLARVGVRTQPSAAERSERDDIHAVSQHWPGVRTIAVVNGKGGASKTPTTALLAATFARYSGAATIAWDNNETRGTLGWRTEQGKHESTVLDLIPRAAELLNPSARAGDISHYVHHQAADKYDVLRSNPNLLSSEQRISGDDVDSIHDVLGRYYRLIFVDSGNDESASHWLRMIDKADQLVVPTIAKPEHAEAGALLLEALTKRGGRSAELAQRAVVIVSQAREKDSNPSAADIARGFEGWVSSAVTIPYDRAMVENVLRFDALGSATQRAWLRAAAAVARQL